MGFCIFPEVSLPNLSFAPTSRTKSVRDMAHRLFLLLWRVVGWSTQRGGPYLAFFARCGCEAEVGRETSGKQGLISLNTTPGEKVINHRRNHQAEHNRNC